MRCSYKATVCTDSNALANSTCPEGSIKTAVYLDKEETGNTNDTPHILPKESCTLHTGLSRDEDEDYNFNFYDNYFDGYDDSYEDDFNESQDDFFQSIINNLLNQNGRR